MLGKNPVPAKMWYKTLAKGKQGWKKITHEEALKKAPNGHRLFSGVIPGLSTKMVQGDCLHIIFTKGVLGHTWIYPPLFYVVSWGRCDPGSPTRNKAGNNLSSCRARVCDPGHSNQNHQLENDHDHKPERAPQDLGQFRPQSIRNQMVPDGFCTNSKRIGDSLTKA